MADLSHLAESSPVNTKGSIAGRLRSLSPSAAVGVALAVTIITLWLFIWLFPAAEGRPFALGVTLLLLVHECGHILAAKWFGLKVSAPIFIPFFGAFVLVEDSNDSWIHAWISLWGPLLGSVAAAGCELIYLVDRMPVFQSIANAGFLINFFNLFPAFFLDGSRIVKTAFPASQTVRRLALTMLGFLFTYRSIRNHPIGVSAFVLGYLLVGEGIVRLLRWKRSRGPSNFGTTGTSYSAPVIGIERSRRHIVALVYVIVLITLAVGLCFTDAPR
jgi:Zn-dependent protease